MKDQPRAWLIQPPVYDFALYDHFLKPYGLYRLGRLLADSGWEIRILNCLDHRLSPESPPPRRRNDGTGKFLKTPAVFPPPLLKNIQRRYSRYGIPPEVMRRRLGEFRPDFCFITTGMTYWYPGVREAAAAVRGLYPGIPLIAGGIYGSLLPEHCLEVCGIDFVFPSPDRKTPGPPGEDPVFAELGAFLRSRGFPFPAAPPADLNPFSQAELWNGAGVIRLNRGCPFNCAYCASRRLNGGFTPGNPEAAWESLEELARGGIRRWAFYDDALLYRKEEILFPLLEKVVSLKRNWTFYTPNGVHIRGLDREAALLMRRAGFGEVRFGFESSLPAFHRAYDEKWEGDEFAHAMENCLAAGFEPQNLRAYILAGLPGQRAEEAAASAAWVKRAGLAVSVAEFSPVPGSPLWDLCAARSDLPLKEEPLYQNNCFFPMESEIFTAGDLRRLKQSLN
ncbi:MAG: radical SAM protein [Spirochaetales bacterium]|jgi:radical SAM superfamily enzyme YgiQ (UPF0313 family)|nr:radical SAM protein [Spirochaetales bacterium]